MAWLSVIEPLMPKSQHTTLDRSALSDCSEYVVWNSPKAVAGYTMQAGPRQRVAICCCLPIVISQKIRVLLAKK